MTLIKQTFDWNELAELDPMWAVLSEPGTQHGNWNADEFFATGKREVAEFCESLRRLGMSQEFDSALDYGCGLGRITRAFRAISPDVLGVDTSYKMIELAQSLNPECHFKVNPYPDLRLIPPNSFQLVYCRRVLQHQAAASVILRYVSEFVRVLKPAGVLAFQIPRRIPLLNRIQFRRRMYALLRTAGTGPRTLYKLGLYPISMTAVSAEKVLAAVQAAKGRLVSTQFEPVSCPGIPSNFFYVTK